MVFTVLLQNITLNRIWFCIKTHCFSQKSFHLTSKNNMIECVCKQKNHIANPHYFVFIILKSCLPPERKGGSPNKYAVVSAYKIFLKKTARRRKEQAQYDKE